MQWLAKIVQEVQQRHPGGEIIIESGVSPSGTYHVGTLREVLTADAVKLELERRGRTVRHIHFVDDFDALRKIPVSVPADFSKHLGKPLSDIPAPDGSTASYADYFLENFLEAAKAIGIEMEVLRSRQRYRDGFFAAAIEAALQNIDAVRASIEQISGRQLEPDWAPIQIMEDEYLKTRPFVSIDTTAKTIRYKDKDGQEQITDYQKGQVKLTWRLDWPARWWLLKVAVEPFGRDHATKGGSYETGAALISHVFGSQAPIPVPYEFINLAGQTKKMSKSAGDTIAVSELLKVLPPEVIRFFVLRYNPDKQLYFDEAHGVMKLTDEFAELLAKPDKTEQERQLIYLSTKDVPTTTVSNIPFSHLVASYQAALKDIQKTLEIIGRTEHHQAVESQKAIIANELKFIDEWLGKWAPEDVKFEIAEQIEPSNFSQEERTYLLELSKKITQAPANADAQWFHDAIYELQAESGLEPKQLFSTLYKAIIGQESGPRAGWFLSILPRDWLISRLKLEK